MGTACDDVCDNGGLKSVGMLDGEHLVAVDGRQVRPGHMLFTTHDSDQTAPLGYGFAKDAVAS